MNTIYCPLSRSECIITTSCKTIRDAWHALDVSHEETNQVK
jgi:hypothetical protein